MSSREEVTLPATRPKSRKSLAHIPSSHEMDRENVTTDIGALASVKKAVMKKSRSRSIGPGGLDALKDTTGNRRKSLVAVPHPTPKSILKPTMPSLREIPAHISTRKSPKKATHPNTTQSDMLIDFNIDAAPRVTGADSLANPFEVEGSPAVNETRVTLRTEEQQQAAAREREEKERSELEKEMKSRRDARRKSLANRRVSFAPEATLHTWDVVVEYQDSTTSSNSTNSTQRASSATSDVTMSPARQTLTPASSDPSEAPSTPPEQVEEETVSASPAHQRDLHQKKRRRSSGIPPMNFNNPDDEFLSSSPLSGSSVGDADEVVDDDVASNSNSDSDNDDDGTMVSIDGGETTDISLASVKSVDSGSSVRLEEALRQAARQAGTQGIDFDEHGDTEMAEPGAEDDEILASFAPFKKNVIQESLRDQENVNPFSPAFKAGAAQQENGQSDEEMAMDMTHAVGGIIPGQKPDDDEMSMDVTRAFGSIISNEAPKHATSRRKSTQPNRRQSTRRRSSEERSSLGDETMDLTMAVGGIQPAEDDNVSKDDEDMTMELTSVIGGVLPQGNSRSRRRSSMGPPSRPKSRKPRESLESAAGDVTMEMTVAVGGIMPAITETTAEVDSTIGMEMTKAIGGMLPPEINTSKRAQAKRVIELETDQGSSPFQALVAANSSLKIPVPVHTIASETGSPSMTVFRGKSLRRSTDARQSTTPKSERNNETPIKKSATPSKQVTPQPPSRLTTPGKTPPSKNVIMRTASPKRLFKDEIKASSTPQSSATKKKAIPNNIFQTSKETGIATPNFLLTPQRRVSSGVGIDKEGLGSPRVAVLLDRRTSIGEHARSFFPSLPSKLSRGVRFDDPRAIEEEIDKERELEEDRENGRQILEREADHEEEKDATLNLKEMIQSLTPKKKPLKGRKSLHVGAAKGLLGKRPIELDEDEEEENDGMKRLKGRQGSPIKNIKLQGPPSKAETTGRLTCATRKSLETENASSTPSTTSPEKSKATTPRGPEIFKNAELYPSSQENVPSPEKEPIENPEVLEESIGDGRIQLQDFLNMTSIRFMELTTTKRRHTIAPKAADSRDSKQDSGKVSLEACVAAGAATIPMLELFQHACHELKSYISEGRKTVREIESETFEENPPLFREYISAQADVKVIMDNQLKNVKTHARLLSKGMWYEWRMTLLATLRDGFFKMADGMETDEETLDEQQALLDSVLPQLVKQAEQLEREETELQSAAEELANCDQEELGEARQQLITVDADIDAKKQLVLELRRQLQGKEAEILAGTERKQVCSEDIREAEKIREECRGWSSNEIGALKAKVDQIEEEHGWTITGVSGTTTSMTYRKEIELVFDASAFQSNKSNAHQFNSRIDLWYIAASREFSAQPLTPEKDFFLQSIRDHIRGLAQAQTQVKDLLAAVSRAWNKANAASDDIRLLRISCPTEITKTSDNSILVKSLLMIAPLITKVEISFHLTSHSGNDGIDVEVSPSATVVYGERFNEPKMKEFLLTRCGDDIEEQGQSTMVSWGAAMTELGEKLLARGRK